MTLLNRNELPKSIPDGARCSITPRTAACLNDLKLPALEKPIQLNQKDLACADAVVRIHDNLSGLPWTAPKRANDLCQTLESLSPPARSRLSSLYHDFCGKLLHQDLRRHLSFADAQRALALLRNDTVTATAYAIDSAAHSLQIFRSRRMLEILRDVEPTRITALTNRYKRLFNIDLAELYQKRISARHQEELQHLLTGSRDAPVVRLHNAFSAPHRRNELTLACQRVGRAGSALISAYYRRYKTSVWQDLLTVSPGWYRGLLRSHLRNDDTTAAAILLRRTTTQRIGALRSAYAILDVMKPELRNTALVTYERRYGESLEQTFRAHGKIHKSVTHLFDSSPESYATRIELMLHGKLKHPEQISQLLATQPREFVRSVAAHFDRNSPRPLRECLAKNLSGNDRLRALLALHGRPETIDDVVALLLVHKHHQEQSAFTRLLLRVSPIGTLFQQTLDRLLREYNDSWSDKELTTTERVRLGRTSNYAISQLTCFREFTDKLSDMAANAATSAAAGLAAAVLGAFLPTSVAVSSSSVVGACARVAAKRTLLGKAYALRSIPKDWLIGVMKRLQGHGGKRLLQVAQKVYELIT